MGGVDIFTPTDAENLLAKMGKLSCLRKRANKKEYKARLKQEMEARGSTITGLQMKLQKATEELKIVKR